MEPGAAHKRASAQTITFICSADKQKHSPAYPTMQLLVHFQLSTNTLMNTALMHGATTAPVSFNPLCVQNNYQQQILLLEELLSVPTCLDVSAADMMNASRFT